MSSITINDPAVRYGLKSGVPELVKNSRELLLFTSGLTSPAASVYVDPGVPVTVLM